MDITKIDDFKYKFDDYIIKIIPINSIKNTINTDNSDKIDISEFYLDNEFICVIYIDCNKNQVILDCEKDYIKFDNNAAYKINDNELIELLHLCTIETPIYEEVSNDKDDTDCAFVMHKGVNKETTYQIDFNKQNTKYLNIYKLNYQNSLEKKLGVIYGIVTPNCIFNYDKALLDSNDDTDFSINDDCSTESIVEM